MGRNYNILVFAISIFSILISCFKDDEKEYTNVYWIPKNKDLVGVYILDKEFHEKTKFPKDSILLLLFHNNTFKVKNFPYSENYNSNNLNFIPYAEGAWKLDKNPISSEKNDYSTSIILNYKDQYSHYNGYDKYQNKNNRFLKTEEMQMKLSDSSFTICFFAGDPDNNQYRYYFKKVK